MKRLASSMSSSRSISAGLLALALGAGGCASTGSSPPANPNEPVKLEGARYKLLASAGSLDGRVVEFLQRGDTVRGCLVETGPKLRSVTGLDLGTWLFSLSRKKPNEYEGAYRAVGTDGSVNEKQVAVSFVGDSMSWNLESATWERQSESNQLTPDEKAKCEAK